MPRIWVRLTTIGRATARAGGGAGVTTPGHHAAVLPGEYADVLIMLLGLVRDGHGSRPTDDVRRA